MSQKRKSTTYPFPRLLTIPVHQWFWWFISILKDNAEWFECTSGCLPTRHLGLDSKQTHVAHEVNKSSWDWIAVELSFTLSFSRR